MRAWINLTGNFYNIDSLLEGNSNDVVELNDDEFTRIMGTDICRFRGVVESFPPEIANKNDEYCDGDIIQYRYTKKDETTNTENIYDELYIYCNGHWIYIQPSSNLANI